MTEDLCLAIHNENHSRQNFVDEGQLLHCVDPSMPSNGSFRNVNMFLASSLSHHVSYFTYMGLCKVVFMAWQKPQIFRFRVRPVSHITIHLHPPSRPWTSLPHQQRQNPLSLDGWFPLNHFSRHICGLRNLMVRRFHLSGAAATWVWSHIECRIMASFQPLWFMGKMKTVVSAGLTCYTSEWLNLIRVTIYMFCLALGHHNLVRVFASAKFRNEWKGTCFWWVCYRCPSLVVI